MQIELWPSHELVNPPLAYILTTFIFNNICTKCQSLWTFFLGFPMFGSICVCNAYLFNSIRTVQPTVLKLSEHSYVTIWKLFSNIFLKCDWVNAFFLLSKIPTGVYILHRGNIFKATVDMGKVKKKKRKVRKKKGMKKESREIYKKKQF